MDNLLFLFEVGSSELSANRRTSHSFRQLVKYARATTQRLNALISLQRRQLKVIKRNFPAQFTLPSIQGI